MRHLQHSKGISIHQNKETTAEMYNFSTFNVFSGVD